MVEPCRTQFADQSGGMVPVLSVPKLDGVAMTLSDGSRRHYALVFGCDGNRSNTRRLAFGDTEDFIDFMGGYFLIKVVRTTGLLPANTSQIFSVSGRTALLLNGYEDRTDIALAFRSEHRSTTTIEIGHNSAG